MPTLDIRITRIQYVHILLIILTVHVVRVELLPLCETPTASDFL